MQLRTSSCSVLRTWQVHNIMLHLGPSCQKHWRPGPGIFPLERSHHAVPVPDSRPLLQYHTPWAGTKKAATTPDQPVSQPPPSLPDWHVLHQPHLQPSGLVVGIHFCSKTYLHTREVRWVGMFNWVLERAYLISFSYARVSDRDLDIGESVWLWDLGQCNIQDGPPTREEGKVDICQLNTLILSSLWSSVEGSLHRITTWWFRQSWD